MSSLVTCMRLCVVAVVPICCETCSLFIKELESPRDDQEDADEQGDHNTVWVSESSNLPVKASRWAASTVYV
jgi:hypothetical protein